MKLFKVIVPGKRWPDVFYQNKMEAKRSRDHYISQSNHAVVCRGPDHWRGESFNLSRNTPKTGRKRR